MRAVTDTPPAPHEERIKEDGTITLALAQHALKRLGVDERGFDEMDRRFLHALVVTFNGGPVGVETLGAALGEEADTLEHVYEPYLLQEGEIWGDFHYVFHKHAKNLPKIAFPI